MADGQALFLAFGLFFFSSFLPLTQVPGWIEGMDR